MRIWETSDAFPFRTLRALGIVILIHGVIIIGLGIFDLVWTVIKYTNEYENCPTDWSVLLENPCDHNQLVWTYVSSGVWGGFLVLLVGVLGLMFSRWRVRNLRFQRDMFGVGCILLGFPICPAIIVICVLELYYGDGIFYYVSDNELQTEDVAKFVAPLLVGIFAFFAWIVGIAGAAVACCAKVGVQEKTLLYQKPGLQQTPMIVQGGPPRITPQIVAPQITPQIMPQMTPQMAPQATVQAFEIVPIPQPAPPPYWTGPFPMGPPGPFGPMGPRPMGGPMGPPPFGQMGPSPFGPMGPPPMGGPMGPPFGPMGPPPFGPMGPPPFGPMGPPPFGGPPYGSRRSRGRRPLPAIMPPPSTYM